MPGFNSDSDAGRRAPLSMTLRRACRESGFYGDGTRCPTCPIRHLCESEDRWAVPLKDAHSA